MKVLWKKAAVALSVGMLCMLATGCANINIKEKIPFFQKETSEKKEPVKQKAEVKEKEETDYLNTRIVFVNFTSDDIYSLYASPVSSDDWGDNLLGENIVENGVESGYYKSINFKYTEDERVWNFAIEDKTGNRIEYSNFDLTNYESKGITVYLSDDGSFEICEGIDDYETRLQDWIYANQPEQYYYDSEELFKIYQLILASYWSGYVLNDYSEVCDSDLLEDYIYEKELGYAYIDINYDGIPEIIFGAAGESNLGEFVAIYTVDESGNIVEVDTGSSKIEKHLCYDGSVVSITNEYDRAVKYEFWSLGSEEGQVCFSVDYELYNSDDGLWFDGNDSSSEPLTEQKVRFIRNIHPYMPIEYTALMDLPYAVYH